jgi:hypothetical protein
MMAQWADQEDEENDRFSKRNSDKQGNSKTTSTRVSGTTRGTPKSVSQTKKLRLLSTICVIRSQGTMRQFEKVLHKQCPMHSKSRHTLFECVNLHKSLNAPPLPQAEKRKDQEDDDEGDKSGAQDFQDSKNVINIIFGGDGGFPSKRAQKLTYVKSSL